MSERVTLKQIARELGVSVQSVSLALRNQRGVSAALRDRVRARADALGYVPDAGLRALADYRTLGRKAVTRWNRLALVHNWTSEASWAKDSFYRRWFLELERAAGERGIEVETHWLGARGERTAAVFRLLRNRGISGVFVAPPGLTPDPPTLEIPQDSFQVVTFGPEHLYPKLHTVQFDFYGNLRLAWQVLRERGHERIGLVYGKEQGWRTGYAWRAAYHVENLLTGCPPEERMPLELAGQDATKHRKRYRAWLREGGYDAVISSLRGLETWHTKKGPKPEIAMFNVDRPGQQGIDLNLPQMAETAVELMTLEMQRSLVRERSLPFRVHIPGRWVEGEGGDSEGFAGPA